MTTATKPKRKRTSKPKARKTNQPVSAEEPSFFAKALTVRGRFTLAWMMLKAAVRILVKGRALV